MRSVSPAHDRLELNLMLRVLDPLKMEKKVSLELVWLMERVKDWQGLMYKELTLVLLMETDIEA